MSKHFVEVMQQHISPVWIDMKAAFQEDVEQKVNHLLIYFDPSVPLQVRDIALHPEMFSVQNGLLTPTLKAKRNELRSHFREQIDELYAKIKMWVGTK